MRIPDTDPRPWARGKTYAEVLGLTDQAIVALQDVARQQVQAPVQQYQAPSLPDDGQIVDVKMMREYAQQIQQGAQDPTIRTQLAQLNYDRVANESRYKEIFEKYPLEIANHLRQMPAPMWTLDNIRLVGNLVRGEHVDELADARATQKLQQMQGLPIRGNGLGTDNPQDSNGLPANYQEILTKVGVSMSQVDGFCAANGWTREKWFKHYSKNAMGSR